MSTFVISISMEVFGCVSSALQTSAQLITLCGKIRQYKKASKSIKQSATAVEGVGRHFHTVAKIVYEALFEAEVNPNFDVHPDLEKTFKQSNEVLKTAYELVKKWSKRMGLRLLYDEAEAAVLSATLQSPIALPEDVEEGASNSHSSSSSSSPSKSSLRTGGWRFPILSDKKKGRNGKTSMQSPSSTSTKSGDESTSDKRRGPWAFVKSASLRCLFVAYGAKEVERAVDLLMHERSQLAILTNTLPFQFSKRLKKVEGSIVDAWKTVSKSPGRKRSKAPGSEKPILTSYDTSYSFGGGGPAKIIVRRKKIDESRADPRHGQVDGLGGSSNAPQKKEKKNDESLTWIVNMLGAIPEGSLRDVGLLHCAGHSERDGYDMLIFDPPSGCPNVMPVTLRARLSDRSLPAPSLTDRIRIAQTLVASVVVLHSLGIVHRFLTPEGIMLFPKPGDAPSSLGDLYLLGFGQSRPEKGGSLSSGDMQDNFRARFYTHPYILASPRICKFEMKHDIFSLGLCLLEIALWEPFFVPLEYSSEMFQKSANCELKQDNIIFDNRGGPYESLDEEKLKDRMRSEDSMWKETCPSTYDVAMERRDVLVELAKARLPPLVGQIFCDAIVTCLEIDKRQLSKVVVTRDCVYAAGQTTITAENMSVQTEAEGGPSDQGRSAPVGALSIACETLVTGSVLSSPSSGNSTPGSDESGRTSITLCNPEPQTTATTTEEKVTPADEHNNKIVGGGKEKDSEVLDRFMAELLKMKEMSGSSAHTIIIARNILKSLERLNL